MLKSWPSKVGLLSAVCVSCFLLYELTHLLLEIFDPGANLNNKWCKEVFANVVFLCLACLATKVMLRLTDLQAMAQLEDAATLKRMEEVMFKLDTYVSWNRPSDSDSSLPPPCHSPATSLPLPCHLPAAPLLVACLQTFAG